ncbi:sulfurtransferase [Flavisolibacter tropicus]|uniref:Sulfurtransferase n=1 Tax=Flavisolibacter tropicus TaxID=1492898 RepID=A0A172U0Y6_9BACT|nr:sulfurtransferase [Flavisolibacter tropicus]ANE52784.1 sulfurtransferase [Flavisolibacter tropicus]
MNAKPLFPTPIISIKQFQTLAAENYILIDARSGPQAISQYQAGHLPHAQFVDLDQDLAEKPEDAAKGGRHPLPSISSFAALLGCLGITPSSTVVVYDDKSGANAAARFWWMLRATGHSNVYVLDGGLQAAVAAGIALTTEVTHPKATMPYPVTDWQLPTASIETVEAVSKNPDYVVIDVRDAYRYRGESEPIDLVAGHIPGAINIPFSQNLNAQNDFRTGDELAQTYKPVVGDRSMDHIIVHCGSGVTACHTLLALEQAGMPGAQLYVGSWGEWSRTDRPINTGDKP